MSFDQHEFHSAPDGSPNGPASASDAATTLTKATFAVSDAVDIEVVKEWLPGDPARSVEALLIIFFVMFGCGLATWVIASLR